MEVETTELGGGSGEEGVGGGAGRKADGGYT